MSRGLDFLGPFRLIRLLRGASTCQVWEAINDTTGDRRALKILQREHLKNKQELNYLRQEAAVGKTLNHKTVIQIYGYIDKYDLPFLELELFQSKNLKQVLRGEPEHIRYHLREVLDQCADGLSHLHQKGWIHCDVKPDNFLINDDGKIKLIDFSIAQKPKSALASMFSFSFNSTIAGTRSYMSPEQIRKQNLTARSDIYSFGCMVFELLTNKMPFTGSSSDDLLYKHLNMPAPVASNLNREVTREMSDFIQRLMQKDPAHRPESMWQVRKTLEKIPPYRYRKEDEA
ncbi:MAG: serine/threonine protein kinase [bacterium]|nr:serine/threonine protein kinase [bacterium]